MEPANVNSTSDEDRRLERLLQQSAAQLPDDGFSQRVLSALPPKPARSRAALARLAWCLAGAAAGLALAWQKGVDARALAAAADRFSDSLNELGTGFASTPLSIYDSGVSISVAVTAVSLLIAFVPNVTRRWSLR